MKQLLALLVCLGAASLCFADEGMWTYDNFPVKKVKQKYGFEPSEKWLDHLRLSSVRIGGASGSIVSNRGLVLTNAHVVRSCLQQLTSALRDYVADGLLAMSEADELKCPSMEVVQLLAISDVTA